MYLRFKRQQMILVSVKEDGTCPYLLSEKDLELLVKLVEAKQLNLWSYKKAAPGEIGSFVPIAVMQETKKTEVEVANQEVNKRLSSAIKKLVQAHTREQMEIRKISTRKDGM